MEIAAQPRKEEGRGASRRIRRAGGVPGIIYGGDATPTPITLDHNTLYHALRKEAFHSSILTVRLDKKPVKALLRDVQMHPYKQQVLHIDFQRIDPNRKIHMKVPLHFINGEISPAVKLEGALINQVMNELEISCLPKDLPEYIEVDLSEMTVATSMHVSSLKLPEGVTVVITRGFDPTVVSASVVKEEVESAEEVIEGEASTTAAEPGTKEE
ncbi:MAG: 50S ribosomal protein L25/general stress protein Ctc [Burkholderiales bacterium]|nr:50S ribosomal protein L25/general stress protein Ctc [Burkholderiales bacterium]